MIVEYSAPPASAPEPRLTARSMLSLGTEDFLAFWMASYRVGLPAGSPPPVRAATSMFLMSLANILPRLASMTAFLCFVVAHLLWPDIALPPRRSVGARQTAPDHLDEEPVHAGVPGDLGVERRREQVPLPHRHDPTFGSRPLHRRDPGEHLDVGRHLLDPGGADEDRPHLAALHAGEGQVLLEALDLPAEGVAAHRHVDAAERLLPLDGVDDAVREEDHARARAVRRHALLETVEDGLAQLEGAGELVDGRRLPAGQHERVDLGELGRPADGSRHDVALGERRQVLADVALPGEDADDGVVASGHVGGA